ncbi:MAG TPA: transposase [Gemmataceae bacterium]|nr:transposase [Gemmataceae bacterium]
MRELKGLEIAARCKITFDGEAWLVPSQSGSGKYKVLLSPDGDACLCEDFQLTKKPCKHVHAARFVRERDYGGKSPVVVDSAPKRPTYPRDWPAFNLAQSVEKDRLQVLLAELCRGIQEPVIPADKPGRRPHLLRDAVFAMAFKVYSTFSARRFTCDLRDAHEKGYLSRSIHGIKVLAFFENPDLGPVLQRLITQSALPLATVETTFAPDSTGFSTSRFVRWYDEKYGIERSGKEWVKAHAICGVKTNICTSVEILDKNAADCPQFAPLVKATAAAGFDVQQVPADKAYLSHDNLELVASLGGTAYIPFKADSVPGDESGLWARMFHYFNFRRDEFLAHYHQRSNIESTFSMLKRKHGDAVRSKTDAAMRNEVFCKFLCHNLCCLIQAQCELGIEPVFWQDEPKGGGGNPDVLPMVRPG